MKKLALMAAMAALTPSKESLPIFRRDMAIKAIAMMLQPVLALKSPYGDAIRIERAEAHRERKRQRNIKIVAAGGYSRSQWQDRA